MARQFSAKRPENLKGTICKLLGYMGNHKFLFLLVALLTTVSASAGLYGTYMLKPIVNDYIVPGNMRGLFYAVLVMGAVYLAGVIFIRIYAAYGNGSAENYCGNQEGFILSYSEAAP